MGWGKAGSGSDNPTTSAAANKYGPWDPTGMASPGGYLSAILAQYDMKSGDFRPWTRASTDIVAFKVEYPQGRNIRVTVLIKKGTGWEVWVGSGTKKLGLFGIKPGSDGGDPGQSNYVGGDGGAADLAEGSFWDRNKGLIIGGSAAAVVIGLLWWTTKGKR